MNEAGVMAIRDVGCQNAAKFVYRFAHPLSHDIVTGFEDCAIVVRRFSKLLPFGKDLVAIRRAGDFSAAFVIGSCRVVVSFDGDAKSPDWTAIEAFDRRLHAAGYGLVFHPEESDLQPCGRCPAGALKRCGRHDDRLAPRPPESNRFVLLPV